MRFSLLLVGLWISSGYPVDARGKPGLSGLFWRSFPPASTGFAQVFNRISYKELTT
jgi:hypothetical protein